MIRLTTPEADWNAVTTMARLTPAKSASGARIGIARAAWPDVDGTRNASGMLIRNISAPKTPLEVSLTMFSIECRIVPVISELFMITVTPRASTMIRPTPMKSPAPLTSVSVMPFSPRPPMRPTTIAITMNSAASSGKYQSSCQA